MASLEDKKLVGLRYRQEEGLPRVVIKSSGKNVDELLKASETNKEQRIVKDKELLKKLYRLPIDAEITPDMFQLVAVMISHVFSINEIAKRNNND